MKCLPPLLALALTIPMSAVAASAPGYLGDLVNQDRVIGNTVYGPAGTPVSDIYSFDIGAFSAETIATAVKVSLQFGSSATPIFDIGNFAIALRDVNGFQYAYDDTFNASGELEFQATLAPSTVGLPGFYEFVVTGVTAGSTGGTYLGALSAQPIPEPKQWMLMLAGAGLIGLMVERVKHRQF